MAVSSEPPTGHALSRRCWCDKARRGHRLLFTYQHRSFCSTLQPSQRVVGEGSRSWLRWATPDRWSRNGQELGGRAKRLTRAIPEGAPKFTRGGDTRRTRARRAPLAQARRPRVSGPFEGQLPTQALNLPRAGSPSHIIERSIPRGERSLRTNRPRRRASFRIRSRDVQRSVSLARPLA